MSQKFSMIFGVLLIVTCFPIGIFSVDSPWDYATQGDNWKGTCSAGKKQSPVHLSLVNAVYNSQLKPITFDYANDLASGTFSNNGHSVVFALEKNEGKWTISSGGLDNPYILHSLHFHWGLENCEGSEHVMEYKRAPLELHLVHYNSRYKSLTEAKTKADGLAVVSIMFSRAKTGSQPSSKLGKYLTQNLDTNGVIDKLKAVGNSVTQSMTLDTFVEEAKTMNFFRYSGSLTTPTCDESVTWSVVGQWLDVDGALLDKLRLTALSWVDGSQKPSSNYRAIQPLNGRAVFSTDKMAKGSGSGKNIASLAAAVLPSIVLFLFKRF